MVQSAHIGEGTLTIPEDLVKYAQQVLGEAANALGYVETPELEAIHLILRQEVRVESRWRADYVRYDRLGTMLIEGIKGDNHNLARIGFDACKGIILIESNQAESAYEHFNEMLDELANYPADGYTGQACNIIGAICADLEKLLS